MGNKSKFFPQKHPARRLRQRGRRLRGEKNWFFYKNPIFLSPKTPLSTTEYLSSYQNCDVAEAKELIEEFTKSGTTTKDVFLKLQTWIGDRILVDKSPSYALDLAAMHKVERDFENPIYIHLVRHPYSMAVSFEKYHIEQVLFLEKNPYSERALGAFLSRAEEGI
ncbi:MAG: hypothetical protein ACI9XO_001625 [Paraglaciecola sp.]